MGGEGCDKLCDNKRWGDGQQDNTGPGEKAGGESPSITPLPSVTLASVSRPGLGGCGQTSLTSPRIDR